MVNNIMGAMKTAGGTKAAQSQKNRRSAGSEQSAFNQALSDAVGAANSASTQPADKNTYDKKDVSADKEVKDVEEIQENAGEQEVLAGEKVLGQEVFASTMQMGSDGVQMAEEMNVSWDQALTEVQGNPEAPAENVLEGLSEIVQEGTIAKTSEEKVLTSGEISVEMADQMEEAEVLNVKDIKESAEMSGQELSSTDTGAKKTADREEIHKEEPDFAEVKTQAAAEHSDLSHVHASGNEGKATIQTEVEVTGSGDIKPEYANMLKDIIARQLANGRQEIEISLTPRNLGELLVKVAYEAGEATVSIICTNAKTMEAMSSRASELGKVLETTLGDKMEVVVENKEQPGSHLYEDGKNDSGAQAQKEELEKREAEMRRRLEKEAGSVDFLHQLRLGLA